MKTINQAAAAGVVFGLISLPVNVLNGDTGTPACLLWEERTTSMPTDLCLNLSFSVVGLVDPILGSRIWGLNFVVDLEPLWTLAPTRDH